MCHTHSHIDRDGDFPGPPQGVKQINVDSIQLEVCALQGPPTMGPTPHHSARRSRVDTAPVLVSFQGAGQPHSAKILAGHDSHTRCSVYRRMPARNMALASFLPWNRCQGLSALGGQRDSFLTSCSFTLLLASFLSKLLTSIIRRIRLQSGVSMQAGVRNAAGRLHKANQSDDCAIACKVHSKVR